MDKTEAEILYAIWENSGHGTRLEDIEAAYAAGVAVERERCAKLCEDALTYNHDDPGAGFAAAIRAISVIG